MDGIRKQRGLAEVAVPENKPRVPRKAEKPVSRDAFEAPAPHQARAKLVVRAPPAERPAAQERIPSFSEFAEGKAKDTPTLREFVRETGLKRVFEDIQSKHSDDSKVRNLKGELQRYWTQLESAQKAGNVDEVASIIDEITPMMNKINESLNKGAKVQDENIENPPKELRLADRLTADEAAEKITEFNQLFKSPDYSFKDLKGQTFSRAEDQAAVKSKMGGKGIGPFYLNEKGDKMLAPDRDAHGGGTFKYFKKVDNQWARQQTLDHEGKPFRT